MKIGLTFLLKHTINHATVPEKKRRGRRGYGTVKPVRLLVYCQSKGIHKDKQLVRHLNNSPDTAKQLGFKSIPHRTTIGRWKKRIEVQKSVFEFISSVIQTIIPTELLVVDSTPLVDYRDPEAEIGFYSRGPFKGFKAHLSVNQLGLPLNATVTKGNAHDSTQFNQLVNGLNANCVLGDSAYDSKDI